MTVRALLVAALLSTFPVAAIHAQTTDAAPAKAPEATPILTVGDPAPALTIEEWVRGEPLTGFEKGKIYIVEFWATWCGPCIAGIPHLTELQKKYADQGVTVVAVTTPDARGNTLDKVKKLVKKQNDDAQMLYTVAWDGSKNTGRAYMKASKQGGIPCAFLVDRDSKIAYIGHPGQMDDALAAVVKGDWDITKERARYENEQAKDRRVTQFFEDIASGKSESASKIGAELVDKDFKDDAGMLNMIAWQIVDPQGPAKNRDLPLAMRAASRASELTDHKELSILDTLARVHFLQGDLERAITLQEKAISLAESDDDKKALTTALDEYKKARKQ